MRALTVRQPYAGAIALGFKDVENRSASWQYRGHLLIHAGLQYAGSEAYEKVRRLTGVEIPMVGAPGADPAWTFGAIVALVDLRTAHRSGECGAADGRGCSPWAEPFTTHLRLHNARPLKRPVFCNGRQGLWTPDDDVLAQVRRQLS